MEIKIVSINGQEVNNPKYQDKETDTGTFFYDESFEDYKKNPFFTDNENEIKSFSMVLSIEFEDGEITESDKEKLLKFSENHEELES